MFSIFICYIGKTQREILREVILKNLTILQ